MKTTTKTKPSSFGFHTRATAADASAGTVPRRRASNTTPRALLAPLIACLLLVGSGTVSAADLFSVQLNDTNNAAHTATAGGSSLLDLIEEVIKNKNDFASFKNADFTSSLDYLGIAGAIKIDATSGEITLDIPSIKYRRVFGSIAGDRDDIADDVEDWLLKGDGLGVYSKFLKEMAKKSLVAINDGNPSATTARAATRAFFHFGFSPVEDMFILPLENAKNDAKADAKTDAKTSGKKSETCALPWCDCATRNRYYSGLALQFSAGNFTAGDFKGTYADFSIPWRAHCGRRVDLAMEINFNGTEIEDAQVFGFGLQFALPIHIIKADARGDRWNWRITPFAGADVRGSMDMIDGAGIWMAGGVSALDFRVLNWFALSLVNQLSLHKSVAVPIGDGDDGWSYGTGGFYDSEFAGSKASGDLDPDVSQLVLKNALRAGFAPCGWFFGSVHVAHTRFLRDATVKDYFTFGAAITLHSLRDWRFQAAVNYDTGSHYKAATATLASVWSF
ncbi:MAG: hypothetical protein LBR07_04380 [Puniceicoccales bacterium]|jgi:hypothetical protein|nr:hypothetical protein [Puniceicoccales bacterium]